jgi:hypothetical protein
LILGFVISLVLADWGSVNHPSFNFYILPTRGYELLAGSILAYLETRKGHRSQKKTLNLIFPSFGFFLIIYSILFFNDDMPHPSFYTLSPIIGVCLIIWFSCKNELITRVLSTKLFVGVGLISYSLYLWHYPIFAFARMTELFQGSLLNNFFLGMIILILSIISYKFVERPARNKKYKSKIILGLILILISVLVILNLNILSKDGYKNRMPEIIQKNQSKLPWNLLKNLDGDDCYDNINGCRFNSTSNKKIFIIGDSHMGSLIFDLKNRVVKNDYQFIINSLGNCLFYPGFNLFVTKTQKTVDNCNNNYFQKLKKNLSNEKNSIIIFGGRFPLH